MIESLQELSRLLSTETVTVEAVSLRVGRVTAEHGVGGSLELLPSDARLRRADLFRDPVEPAVPDSLMLEFASGAEPTLSSLGRTFGAWKRVTGGALESRPAVRFASVAVGEHFVVSLKAVLPEGTAVSDGAVVRAVELLREPRLD